MNKDRRRYSLQIKGDEMTDKPNKPPKITASFIKDVVTNAPHFFDRKTLKFFGQTMRDFKVSFVEENIYFLSAPIKMDNKFSGKYSERYFNLKTKRLWQSLESARSED